MADRTSIEWTDATWNVVNGCSVCSPGCTHCYAMKLAGTRLRNHPTRAGLTVDSKAGPVWTGEIRVNEAAMEQPLRWTRPRMIFANAHGDLFHERVPIETIARVFGVAIAAHHLRGHIVQFLTKRAERQRDVLSRPEFWEEVNTYAEWHVMERVDPLNRRSDDARATLDDYDPDSPPPGIWIGVSAENQHWLMQRGPHLVETPAAVRFLSIEPLLSVMDIEPFVLPVRQWSNMWANNYPLHYPKHRVDWVIVGGESGPGARPMHPDWARSLRDQCAAGGVPFFFKQWGEWLPWEPEQVPCWKSQTGETMDRHALPDFDDADLKGWTDRLLYEGSDICVHQRVGKKTAGRLLDGVQHEGMPA